MTEYDEDIVPIYWQESSYTTDVYVKKTLETSFFHKHLHNEASTIEEDIYLRNLAKLVFCNYDDAEFKYISFAKLRNSVDWQSRCESILNDEIANHSPYGSTRGFHVFVFHNLYSCYISRVIRELWAQSVIVEWLSPLWKRVYWLPVHGVGFHRVRHHYCRISS
jgi:hypothetical protein